MPRNATGLRFEGDALRCVAMPLGGLGTGNLAVCGDGSLRQWQVHNRSNHLGYLPHSFFGLAWRTRAGQKAKLLQSDRFWNEPGFTPPPTSSDHYVPRELVEWARGLPCADVRSFEAIYPCAQVEFDLSDECPLEATMTAWSPLTPKDPANSGWPVAVFDFRIRNRSDARCTVSLLSSLQNAVGWDGTSVIEANRSPGYGGNVNEREQIGGAQCVVLSNPSLDPDHPGYGLMALCGLGGAVSSLAEWSCLSTLWREFAGAGRLPESRFQGPSPRGETVNAALVQRVNLEPGEEAVLTVLHAWHFPNRYVDWVQWEKLVPKDKSRFYLGNAYARRGSLRQWLPDFVGGLDRLRRETEEYVSAFACDGLSPSVAGAISANVANLRTNVCLWTEDDRFHGFEGAHGASTWEGMHSSGGCCPMNCTHVWNYEQGLVELWPTLFRGMRDTDWKVNQNAAGYLPHRTPLPVYLPRLWDIPIGGPENPALDGLFAAILKTYQYWLATGDRAWIEEVWPKVRQGLKWTFERHDTEGDGLIRGEQPNTYDIHLFGPNTFIGSQYLAALRAGEELARHIRDETASECRRRFESGSALYLRECFNGEFFVQRVPPDCNEPYQFGPGCCTDQLLGQWWSHHLGLGYVLPREAVASACRAIFNRNFRADFRGFVQAPRVFASEHDRGLLNATYEEGQRPEVPLLYSDEVWPGVEYAFAALCLHEGLTEQALTVVEAVRGRYDGRERNPFNEIECGDHYIRSLSSWSLLPAIHGCRYEAPSRTLHVGRRLPGEWSCPVSLGPAFGRVRTEAGQLHIRIDRGAIEVDRIIGATAESGTTYLGPGSSLVLNGQGP